MKITSLSESFLKDSKSNPKTEEIDISPLSAEIDLIDDITVKKFVRFLLKNAPAFWKAPGFHIPGVHPKDEDGEGGLVLHTKRVIRAIVLLSMSIDIETGPQMDCLIAAGILHDVTKYLYNEEDNSISYDEMHPYSVDKFAKWAVEFSLENSKADEDNALELDPDSLDLILRLIRCSHGIWSPIPETVPLTNLEMLLHHSDFIASHLDEITQVCLDK